MMLLFASRDQSGPLGRRHADPRHRAGEWHSRREEKTPADQQGTGRPWSGARYSDDEEDTP